MPPEDGLEQDRRGRLPVGAGHARRERASPRDRRRAARPSGPGRAGARSTGIQGTPRPAGPGRSATTATAPRRIASGAWASPSDFAPRIATKRSPGTNGARIARDPSDLDLPRRGTDLGARQDGGELHQRHGADGGGAVSSAGRPARRGRRRRAVGEEERVDGARPDGRAGRRVLGDDEARSPEAGPGRRARAKTASACRADIPSALGVRSSGSAARVSRSAAATRARCRAGTRAARRRLGENGRRHPLFARRHAQDPERLRHHAREQRRRHVGRVVLALRLLEDDDRDAARRVGGSEARRSSERGARPGIRRRRPSAPCPSCPRPRSPGSPPWRRCRARRRRRGFARSTGRCSRRRRATGSGHRDRAHGAARLDDLRHEVRLDETSRRWR